MPGRILVVDDLPTMRLIVRAKLAARYYDVIEAADAAQALHLAEREQPDLILLDVVMPGMDGFETCRRLKANPETLHIPVVMLTALDGRADRLAGLEAGADDFVSQPYDDKALLSRIGSLVRMKMMMDELRLRDETSRELGLANLPTLAGVENFCDSAVLVVARDDDPLVSVLDEVHARLGCRIELAPGEHAAHTALAAASFDLCLVWPGLAGVEPIRLASRLRARARTRLMPVVLLVPDGDDAVAGEALDLGVADILRYPPDLAELVARIKVQLRRKLYADRLRDAMRSTLAMALTDPLTGLYNRRYALNHLETLAARHAGGGAGFAVMLLDIDRFKVVNDTLGHRAGDQVLRALAERLRENVRAGDLVSRIGGEEFLVVMPDASPAHAHQVAERVRAAIGLTGFELDGVAEPLKVTASIGVAFARAGEHHAELLDRADAALYTSKSGGRNLVTLSAAA